MPEHLRGGGHRHPPERLKFANSMAIASKVRNLLAHRDLDATTDAQSEAMAQIKRLAHGLVAMEFRTADDAKRGGKQLKLLGGRPSLQQVTKLAHPMPRLQTRPDPRLDNAATLAHLLQADAQGPVATLQRLPQDHAMQPAAACVAAWLTGLGKSWQHQAATPAFRHDPLVANGLNALANAAATLPTLSGDSPRFFAAFAAVLEELNLLLVATRPYGSDDFKAAALSMLKARAGKVLDELHIAPPETWLCSSGTGALLSTGLDAAKALNGSARFRGLTEQAHQPLYYEAFKRVRHDEHAMAGEGVFMGILNASLPGREGIADETNNWDARKLVRKMHEWFAAHEGHPDRPAVLLLDTTVEKQGPGGTSDLAEVLAGLKEPVNQGWLKILLCKSLEKYTMGGGKFMAGSVTLIARPDSRTEAAARQLKDIEDDLGWMLHDESQLLTHLLTHAHASELTLIGNAARNAAFIDDACLRTRPGATGTSQTRREEGLPFVVAQFRSVEVAQPHGPGTRSVPVTDLAMPQITRRGGFGYLPSVGFGLDETLWRITAGQETRAELTEKFYGFGWLNDADVKTLTAAAVLSQASRIAEEAAQAVYGTVDVSAWAEAALRVLRRRSPHDGAHHAAAPGRTCRACVRPSSVRPSACGQP